MLLGDYNWMGDSSEAAGGSFRYRVQRKGGKWQVISAEPVSLETDCWGNVWFKIPPATLE